MIHGYKKNCRRRLVFRFTGAGGKGRKCTLTFVLGLAKVVNNRTAGVNELADMVLAVAKGGLDQVGIAGLFRRHVGKLEG